MYSTRKTLPHDPAEILGELSGAVLDIRHDALLRDFLNVPAEQLVYELKETLAVREVALSYQLGEFGAAADGAGRCGLTECRAGQRAVCGPSGAYYDDFRAG